MSTKNNILILGFLLLISEVLTMAAMQILSINANSWLRLICDVSIVSIVVISIVTLVLRFNFSTPLSQLGLVAIKIFGVIFFAEGGLMAMFHLSGLLLTTWNIAVLDGVLFAVMSAPIIYHWAIKPVVKEHPSRTLSLPIQVCIVFSFALFMFDLSLPLGVAGGIPYIMLVLVGLWFPYRNTSYVLAFAGTILTVIGYLFSEVGGVYWMALANRALAIFALWVTAVLVAKYKMQTDELKGSRNQIKTRFKKQTKELRESEQRFRDFAQSSADWLWETDENLRFTYFSEGISDVTDRGIDINDLLGKTRREIAAETTEDSDKWAKHFEDMEAHKPIRDFTYTYVTPDGETIYFSVNGIPTYDEQGHFRGYRGAGHNITDKVLAEKKVKASEERLSLIFETAAVPLTVIRLSDSTVIYTNSAWLELFGLDADDIGDVRMEELYADPADRRAFLEKLEVTGRVQGMTAQFKRKSGETFYASFNSTKAVLDGEDIVISGLIDITDRKRIEMELRQHRDNLEELVAQRTLDVQEKAAQLEEALESEKQYSTLQQQFVSLVSHEFRTPLTIIDGSAQRIIRTKDKITPDQLVERSSKIRHAVERMVGLVETTLYAERLDAGKIKIHTKPCNIRRITAEVCAHHREISPRHDIRIDLHGMPEQIVADPKFLEHIFTNLLSNAIKYTPGSPLIEVTGTTFGDMALISVEDHGLGIAADDMSHMFERFFRAKTAAGIKGTGLGLSVCKEFVEMHGGTIEVESVEGQGSKFTVKLPIDGKAPQTRAAQP